MVGEELIQQVTSRIESLLTDFAAQIANAILAVVVIGVFFAIGYIVAWVINKILVKLFEQSEIEKIMKQKGYKLSIAGFTITGVITTLVKVFIILAFLGAAAQIVSLGLITDIIIWILWYLPMLVQGVVIIIAAMIFADYLSKVIKKAKEIPLSSAVAMIVQVFVGYIALVMALPLILPGVNVGILTRAFELFVAAGAFAIGIALAIALGWGTKDAVSKAASNHPKLFEDFFGEVEKGAESVKKKR